MKNQHPTDPELQAIDSVYEALDAGDPEQALRLARSAQATDAADPVMLLLAGVALLDLDRPFEAVVELVRAAELDPEDAEIRAKLGLAMFLVCRFDEAERHTRAALEGDGKLPEAHYVRGLLHERAGKHAQADERFEVASRLDPESFPLPRRLTSGEFDERLRVAMDRLPEEYQRHLEKVVVTVEDLPADEILLEEDPPLDPEGLLGLFVGISRDQGSSFSPGGELPPRILLFKRNLERLVLDHDELAEQIAITLYHELGHYLGLDEDELADIDLA